MKLTRARVVGAVVAAVALTVGVVAVATDDGTTPAPPPRTRIGMSAPADQWAARLAETGPVDARRLFATSLTSTSIITTARSEIAAGRLPVLSFKIPGNDWAGAANGTYDTQLRDITTKLAALPGQVFVAIHHEPNGDGTLQAFAAMQRHVLPILATPTNVDAGVIMNGFIWSARPNQGLSDAEIAQWLPTDVLRLAEVVAGDFYEGGTAADPGQEAPGVKVRRFSAWATRVGVQRLGIGEYNGFTPATLTDIGNAVLEDPRFVFALVFNSSENNREGVDWVLTGARLAAFKATVAAAAATPATTTTTRPTTTTSSSTSSTVAPTTTVATTTTSSTPTTVQVTTTTSTTTTVPETTTTTAPAEPVGRCVVLWLGDGTPHVAGDATRTQATCTLAA